MKRNNDELDDYDAPTSAPMLSCNEESGARLNNSRTCTSTRPEHETSALMTWVDKIRPQFILKPSQVREIKGMVMLAQGVDMELLKLHLPTHAAICRMENKNRANNSKSSAVKEVVNVAMKQLSKHMEIPEDIKTKTKATLKKAAKAAGNKMLQQFRDDIMMTLVVDESRKKETLNLEKATHTLCKKYAKGGGGGSLHQFHFAMIADWELFEKLSNTLLPTLPFVVSSTEPTTGCAPLTKVPNSNNRASGAVGNGSETHEEEYTCF
ncbi:hypothetical protein EV368DRAFT_84451 [Lentinula lateritia]|nr:hypothetical protein EV368DRAFT_84451 [Lentinula lateritia]